MTQRSTKTIMADAELLSFTALPAHVGIGARFLDPAKRSTSAPRHHPPHPRRTAPTHRTHPHRTHPPTHTQTRETERKRRQPPGREKTPTEPRNRRLTAARCQCGANRRSAPPAALRNSQRVLLVKCVWFLLGHLGRRGKRAVARPNRVPTGRGCSIHSRAHRKRWDCSGNQRRNMRSRLSIELRFRFSHSSGTPIPAFSPSGRKPPNPASSNTTLRTALWLVVRSPRHRHTKAWSSKRSTANPQHGQVSNACSSTHNQYFQASRQNSASLPRPSATSGAVSHAPAPSVVHNATWGLKNKSPTSSASKFSRAEVSMSPESIFWESTVARPSAEAFPNALCQKAYRRGLLRTISAILDVKPSIPGCAQVLRGRQRCQVGTWCMREPNHGRAWPRRGCAQSHLAERRASWPWLRNAPTVNRACNLRRVSPTRAVQH